MPEDESTRTCARIIGQQDTRGRAGDKRCVGTGVVGDKNEPGYDVVGDKSDPAGVEGDLAGDKSDLAGGLNTGALGHLDSLVLAACAYGGGGACSSPPGSSYISGHIGSPGQISRDTLEIEMRYGHGLGGTSE